jgi:parallel beta-helix repeat protein
MAHAKRTVFGFLLILALCFLVLSAINLRVVSASGLVYIKADGSIDPPTAFVSTVDNLTYTLKGDVGQMVVERNNIVIDGANHTVFSTLTNYGILLNETNNVTVENMQVGAQWVMMHGKPTALDGIRLYSCFNVSIIGNTFTDGVSALTILASNGTTVSDNNILKSEFASSIVLYEGTGISLIESSGSIISDNIMTKMDYAVVIGHGSYGNYFYNNTVTQSKYGFDFSNLSNSWAQNPIGTDNISASNTVDGKPVYYWVGKHDSQVPSDAGDIILTNCQNITMANLNLTSNEDSILLLNTTNSFITQSSVTTNGDGILLINCHNITITENFFESSQVDIRFLQSSGNTIYHNEFDKYSSNVILGGESSNTWDNGYPSGGNCWGHRSLSGGYSNGPDLHWGVFQNRTGPDGIIDTPCVLDNNNTDHYPLASPYSYWVSPIIGDINRNGKVDMNDVEGAAASFGAVPTSLTWNPNADITGPTYLHPDGKVDMRDIALIARNVGKTS